MDPNKLLKEAYTVLKKDVLIINAGSVIGILHAEKVISDVDNFKLAQVDGDMNKTRQLLALLRAGGHPEAFIKLHETLKRDESHEWLVKEIDDHLKKISENAASAAAKNNDLFDLGDPSLLYVVAFTQITVRCFRWLLTTAWARFGFQRCQPEDKEVCVIADVVQPTTTSSTPTLKRVVVIGDDDDRRPIAGITSIDSRLFVLRSPVQQQIQVYDKESFKQQQTLQVGGLRDDTWGSDMTSCVTNQCIYICDGDQDTVYKIELSDNNKVFSWRVGRDPCGLSVNSACNLIVACNEAHMIQEYNTKNGSLVREICLETEDVLAPLHAIQLTGDQFAICCYDETNEMWTVVEVNTDGEVVDCQIDQLNSTGLHEFDFPVHLAVDKNKEYVIVADSDNHRILILKRFLECDAREVNLMSVGIELQSSSCLYFDESQNRLFVGEWRDKSCILVFDNVL